jgi:glycosyltransferase involved in cell wall biosynthesis
MSDSFCLDPAYSTTRFVTREHPVIEEPLASNCKNLLFLPSNPKRKGEGGIRTKGYFKHSLPGKPLITVITVVYNGIQDLEKAIQSVVNQTYDNIEYIVIDGGSIDGTIDLLKKYDLKIDYWLSENDDGIYHAMNKAISLSSGDWIYFIGSDDQLLTSSLSQIAVNLISNNAVYYGDVYYPRSHRLYDGIFTARKLMFRNISHQSIFFPRQLLVEHHFNLKYRTHADYALNMRLFCSSAFTFTYIPVLVAVYNDSNGASSLSEDPEFLSDKKMIIRKFFPWQLYVIYSLRSMLVGSLEFIGMKKALKKLLKG